MLRLTRNLRINFLANFIKVLRTSPFLFLPSLYFPVISSVLFSQFIFFPKQENPFLFVPFCLVGLLVFFVCFGVCFFCPLQFRLILIVSWLHFSMNIFACLCYTGQLLAFEDLITNERLCSLLKGLRLWWGVFLGWGVIIRQPSLSKLDGKYTWFTFWNLEENPSPTFPPFTVEEEGVGTPSPVSEKKVLVGVGCYGCKVSPPKLLIAGMTLVSLRGISLPIICSFFICPLDYCTNCNWLHFAHHNSTPSLRFSPLEKTS